MLVVKLTLILVLCELEATLKINRTKSTCPIPTKYLHNRIQSSVWRLPNYWPPTPSPPSECVLPPHQRRGVHSRRAVRGGGGVNGSEDARHWIGLLQYNPSTLIPLFESFCLPHQTTPRERRVGARFMYFQSSGPTDKLSSVFLRIGNHKEKGIRPISGLNLEQSRTAFHRMEEGGKKNRGFFGGGGGGGPKKSVGYFSWELKGTLSLRCVSGDQRQARKFFGSSANHKSMWRNLFADHSPLQEKQRFSLFVNKALATFFRYILRMMRNLTICLILVIM